jgi:hypothetical protein
MPRLNQMKSSYMVYMSDEPDFVAKLAEEKVSYETFVEADSAGKIHPALAVGKISCCGGLTRTPDSHRP